MKLKLTKFILLFALISGILLFSSCRNNNHSSSCENCNNSNYYDSSKALVVYKSDNIRGYENKPIIIDYYFAPIIKRINAYAEKYGLILYVTSSFRTPNSQKSLSGTVVKPASMSNHLAGHAIDINIVYNNKWYSSTSLYRQNLNRLPYNVRAFINSIRQDRYIRWGGDFTNQDPVHFDDNLNSNRDAWYNRYCVCQRSYQQYCRVKN